VYEAVRLQPVYVGSGFSRTYKRQNPQRSSTAPTVKPAPTDASRTR
jgi:hypothetical protein